MEPEPVKLHFSYNQIHETIGSAAENTSLREFKPTLMLAIGEVAPALVQYTQMFVAQQQRRTTYS